MKTLRKLDWNPNAPINPAEQPQWARQKTPGSKAVANQAIRFQQRQQRQRSLALANGQSNE